MAGGKPSKPKPAPVINQAPPDDGAEALAAKRASLERKRQGLSSLRIRRPADTVIHEATGLRVRSQ